MSPTLRRACINYYKNKDTSPLTVIHFYYFRPPVSSFACTWIVVLSLGHTDEQCFSLQCVCVMYECVCVECVCPRGLLKPHQKAFMKKKVEFGENCFHAPFFLYLVLLHPYRLLRPMCLYSMVYINPSTKQLDTKFTETQDGV